MPAVATGDKVGTAVVFQFLLIAFHSFHGLSDSINCLVQPQIPPPPQLAGYSFKVSNINGSLASLSGVNGFRN